MATALSFQEMLTYHEGNPEKAIKSFFRIYAKLPGPSELEHDLWLELLDATPDETPLGKALKAQVARLDY